MIAKRHLIAFVAACVGLSSGASATKTLACSESGVAYLYEQTGTGWTISSAGYCAFGPWAVEVYRVIPGGGAAESDWRRDDYGREAVATLRRLNNRRLRWTDLSDRGLARLRTYPMRERLVLRADRLPSRVAHRLWPEVPRENGRR